MTTASSPAATHRVLLPAVPPYSFAASLRAMSGFRPSAADQVPHGDGVRKALPRPGRPAEAVVVEVGPRPDAEPGVSFTAYAQSPLSDAERSEMQRTVVRWLGLDDDLAPFLAIVADDAPVRELLATVAGLHQVRFASLAEGAAYFTLTQRSTQWYAAARKRKIADELGPRASLNGVEYVAFPPLSLLAGLAADDLLPFAGNQQRAGRLAEVLAGLAALDEEWLCSAPYEEVRRALLAVRGVGAFTAHAILLRVLGRPDDAPLEMAQFTGLAAAVYSAQSPPSPAELRDRYGRYVGWWAYLTRTALGWRAAEAA